MKLLRRSEFTRNVLILMTGTTIAQSIPIIVMPILTRSGYTESDFGVLAIFLSFVALFSVVSTFRYELAIMLPKDDDDAVNILFLSLIIAFLVSIAVLLVVLIFHNQLLVLLKNKEISFWLYFAPLAIFINGIYQAFNYWSTRNKTFKKNALSRISQTSANSVINLGAVPFKAGAAGLISGNIFGLFVASIILSWETLKNFPKFRKKLSKEKMLENAKKYQNFPKINTLHALLDSLQDNGIVFFITSFFSTQLLGLYSMSFRILKAPLGIFGSSMAQVFYQKASDAYNKKEDMQIILTKMYRNLLIIGLPLFIVLFFISPTLFRLYLGETWLVSGQIAQMIIPWLFLNFLVSPIANISVVVNKQKQAMFIALVGVSVRFISIIIGGIYQSYKLSFILLSFSSCCVLLYQIFWTYQITNFKNISGSYVRENNLVI